MRSEYVYIAWAVVLVAFTWQVNQEPDLSWMEQSRQFKARSDTIPNIEARIAAEDASPMGIIGRDERVQFAAFKPDDFPWSSRVPRDYGASLSLYCLGSSGSASLIHTNDIIAFSLHQILDDEDNITEYLDTCEVRVGTRNKEAYRINWDTLERGAVGETLLTRNDWAFVRLERPIPDVKPYLLPPPNRLEALSQGLLANITNATHNWPDYDYHGMLGQICRLSDFTSMTYGQNVSEFDCDTGRGASGSGILSHDGAGNIYMLAILNRMYRNTVECQTAGSNTCFTVARRMTQDLTDIVIRMAQPNVM